MKKHEKTISNPDDLNKYLKYTSPTTWIVLGLSICLLVGFFTWSCLYKIKEKISGTANVKDGTVTLVIADSNKSKLKAGQKVYISDQTGEIVSLNGNEPVISSFTLDDGEYDYTIVLKEIRPIDFLIK